VRTLRKGLRSGSLEALPSLGFGEVSDTTNMIAADIPERVVFLAEDSEDDAFFFQRALRKADPGSSLRHATNGKAAVEMLEKAAERPEAAPSLMFLDLKMPVMSGFEVLEWLKRTGLKPSPHVIVLSGSNDQYDRARALGLGASDYLVKPISAEILREKITAFFGRERKNESNLEARAIR
jgi:CheY-like chemotaxis protein